MEIQNYPRMLFPGGDTTQPYRIVADEAEDSSARREGYAEAYSVPEKSGKGVTPDATVDATAAADATPAADAPKRRGRPPAAAG